MAILINDIEYCLGLYTMSDDGFPDFESYFDDFHALNAFIRNHADDTKYLERQMCYAFLEIIDGEPGAFSWVNYIEWREFSEEQMQAEINNYIEDVKDNAEHWAKVDEFSKEIHYREDGVDYRKKQHHLKDITYVCPSCIREVADCRCACYPYYLVQIDKLMVPIIHELNSKGYKTTGCCAGHPDEDEFTTTGIYIAFAEDYDFDNFPEGAKYSKSKHTLQFQPPENCENLEDFQRETLWKIEDWAEMLFERDYDWGFDDIEEEDE